MQYASIANLDLFIRVITARLLHWLHEDAGSEVPVLAREQIASKFVKA